MGEDVGVDCCGWVASGAVDSGVAGSAVTGSAVVGSGAGVGSGPAAGGLSIAGGDSAVAVPGDDAAVGSGFELTRAISGGDVAGAERAGAEGPVGRLGSDGVAIAVEADVSNAQQVARMVQKVVSEFGEVSVLVNNAGIERTGAVEETPRAAFRTCMETNYFGAIRCIQAVMKPMRERGSGAIINVTSVAG